MPGNCPSDTRWLLIDASAISQLDSSAAAMLTGLCTDLADRGIKLGMTELHAEAREMLERAGVIECIGSAMVFEDIEDAYRAFLAQA